MRICSFSFDNLKGRSNEDFYLSSKKYPIFAAADGVSGIRNKKNEYPDISGARLAAEVFCKTAIDYLAGRYPRIDLKDLKNSFNLANKAIFNLNEKHSINQSLDYLENDYLCACGVAAFIENNTLYYGYVGDCGITIYNNEDFLKFSSINIVAPIEEWRDAKYAKRTKEYWLVWRKILRNKPKSPYATYGVFTGEPEVKQYYYLGTAPLQKGDLIFIYSDGALCFLKQPRFRDLFRRYEDNALLDNARRFIGKEIKTNLATKNDGILFDDKTVISILI